MSSNATPTNLPRVAAVLVVHNGAEWLSSVLGTLAAQRYPALDLVVVDNASTDASPQLLSRHIPPERLIWLERNDGFGRAVAAALRSEVVATADLVLLLHDDLALAPDAITRLALTLRDHPELGVVGPKLRDWGEERTLQEVGMTTDRFGRAESQLEPGELDQGQHDRQRDALYVSSAGMLLRTEVLRRLGGFDARFPGLRDDLDLCWRAWLAGYRVAAVPEAVGYHVAAGSRHARPFGKARPWEARYLAERHALAAMLKCASGLRLLWVLPVALLLALGKVLGFLATRRFGDALAVVAAYGWNALQLPRTLRRRRIVQRHRVVADRDLLPLFAPGLPRLRAYTEAVTGWLAGGGTRALLDEHETSDRIEAGVSGSALVRSLREHPAAWVGGLAALCYLAGIAPLLGDGPLVGGEIAAWPEDALEFLRAYRAPWTGDPLGAVRFASPVQALLGVVSLLGAGSAWLAQRLVVLGLLPLAWGLALRAGRLLTPAAGPRAVGATLYTLSPVVLGALAEGRLGVLIGAALLPGLVLLGARVLDPAAPARRAWRGAALLALGLAAAAAASLELAGLLGLGVAAALATALIGGGAGRRPAALRFGAAALAAGVLLAPWLIDLLRPGTEVPQALAAPDLPVWRALAAAPAALPGLGGASVVLTIGAAGAILAAAVILGVVVRPSLVGGLVSVLAASALVAAGADRAGLGWIWPPALLLPAALALAGLGAVVAHHLGAGLRAYAFGSRQLLVVLCAGIALLGIVGGLAQVATAPWHGLGRDSDVVPAFVAADVSEVGPYRVLLLEEGQGAVNWELLEAPGRSMVEFGTLPSSALTGLIDDAVGAAIGGVDPAGGARLGLLNVRYVVVRAGGEELLDELAVQPALDPLPVGGGQVLRVRSWLPRAALLPRGVAEALQATGDPGRTGGLEDRGLARVRPGTFVGEHRAGEEAVLVIGEPQGRAWRAAGPQGPLERVALDPVNAFAVPDDVTALTARAEGGRRYPLVLAVQALLVLGLVSLALRPPGFTEARPSVAAGADLPRELTDELSGADGGDDAAPPAELAPAPAPAEQQREQG